MLPPGCPDADAASRTLSQSGRRWASAVREAVMRRRWVDPLPEGARSVTYTDGRRVVVGRTDSMVSHYEAAGIPGRLISFSGYARWGKDQLLREIARGSWGVISKEDALSPELAGFFRGDADLRDDVADASAAQTPEGGPPPESAPPPPLEPAAREQPSQPDACRACRLLMSGKRTNPLWEHLHDRSRQTKEASNVAGAAVTGTSDLYLGRLLSNYR